MRIISFLILCALCFVPVSAHADDMAMLQSQVRELSQMVKDLKIVVDRQQIEIANLKQASPQEPGTPTPTVTSTPRSLQDRWNPDIGVVADIVISQDSPKTDDEGADRVSVRELELVLGSAVDPYSRLDATLAISDFEAMSLEEAYYTHFDIFGSGITGRLGRFKPNVGKVVSIHRDRLDTVDEPLVAQHYFGVEGFNKSGADLSRDMNIPWPITHRLTIGVLEGGNGEGGTLFGEARRRPTIYSHLKNYLDLNDSTGFEFGLSHLTGSRDEDAAFEVNVLGIDGTLIYCYADQRNLKLQGEAYRVSRAESFYLFEDPDTGEFTDQDLDDARHLWGGYALLDWRFHPQWAAGFRWDNVQLIETDTDFANPDSTERAYTGYLTFHQNEFIRWRAQYTHIKLTNANDDHRIYFQGTFTLGNTEHEHEHKH